MAGVSSQPFKPWNQCSWCDEILDISNTIKHKEKYHPRPWKCPSMRCKYHDYGFENEESLQRHVSDKDHGVVSKEYPPSLTQNSASSTTCDATSLASPFDKIHISSPVSVEQPAKSTSMRRSRPRTLARSWTPEAYDVQGQPVPTPGFSPLTPYVDCTVAQKVDSSTFVISEESEWEIYSPSSPMEIAMTGPGDTATHIYGLSNASTPSIVFRKAEVSPGFPASDAEAAFRGSRAGVFTFSPKAESTVTEAPSRTSSSSSSILSPPPPETGPGTHAFEAHDEEMRDSIPLTDSDSPLSSLASTPSPPSRNPISASSSSLSSLSSSFSPTYPSLLPKTPPTSLIEALLPFLLRPSPEHIPTPSAFTLPSPKTLPMGCKACLHAPTPTPVPIKHKKVSDLPFRNLCSSEENQKKEGKIFPRTCIHLSCPVCHHPLPGALALETIHPQPCIYEIPRLALGAPRILDAELTDADADAPGDPDIPLFYTVVLTQHCGSDFFGSAHETQPPIPEAVWESLFVCLAEERLIREGSRYRLAKFREIFGVKGLKARREEVRMWRSRYCVFDKGWGEGIEGDTTGELVYFDEMKEEDGGETEKVLSGEKRKRAKKMRKESGKSNSRGKRMRVS